MAAQFVVLAAQALDGDTDADLRVFFRQRDDLLLEPARGGDDDAIRMLVALFDDLGQVVAYERFAAGQVDEFQPRQRAEIRGFDSFFVGLNQMLHILHFIGQR